MAGVDRKTRPFLEYLTFPVRREEYFESFYELLEKQVEVSDLRKIQDCFVPVIKMKYNGIEVDMTFARLQVRITHYRSLELFLD